MPATKIRPKSGASKPTNKIKSQNQRKKPVASIPPPDPPADPFSKEIQSEVITPFDPFIPEREEFLVISEETPSSSVEKIATDIADFALDPSPLQNAPVFHERVDGKNDISRRLLARIVSMAASEITGIISPSRDLWARIEDLVRGRVNGIRVDVGISEAAVDISTNVLFGSDIPTVSSRLRENIARRIFEMTGLRVVEVNVIVKDVTRPLDP